MSSMQRRKGPSIYGCTVCGQEVLQDCHHPLPRFPLSYPRFPCFLRLCLLSSPVWFQSTSSPVCLLGNFLSFPRSLGKGDALHPKSLPRHLTPPLHPGAQTLSPKGLILITDKSKRMWLTLLCRAAGRTFLGCSCPLLDSFSAWPFRRSLGR